MVESIVRIRCAVCTIYHEVEYKEVHLLHVISEDTIRKLAQEKFEFTREIIDGEVVDVCGTCHKLRLLGTFTEREYL